MSPPLSAKRAVIFLRQPDRLYHPGQPLLRSRERLASGDEVSGSGHRCAGRDVLANASTIPAFAGTLEAPTVDTGLHRRP